MKKVIFGLLLAMASLILLNKNQPLIGLPLFLLGMYLMMHKKK